MPDGRFVTLEGGEGVGKSTQLRRLAAALRADGREVVETREPGGTPGAERVRTLLFEGEWSPAAEALLFAAARADHVETLIRPAVARGAWVLCDRFIDSSRAYQAALGDADVLGLHRIGSGGLLPDRTLVLALDPAAAEARERARDGSADRFARRGRAYHEGVHAFFRRLADAEPGRVRLVDASGAPDAVTRRLRDAMADL